MDFSKCNLKRTRIRSDNNLVVSKLPDERMKENPEILVTHLLRISPM